MSNIRQFKGGGTGATLKLEPIKITSATRIEGVVVEPPEIVEVLPNLARMLISANKASPPTPDELAEFGAGEEGDGGKKPKGDGGKKPKGDGGKK